MREEVGVPLQHHRLPPEDGPLMDLERTRGSVAITHILADSLKLYNEEIVHLGSSDLHTQGARLPGGHHLTCRPVDRPVGPDRSP